MKTQDRFDKASCEATEALQKAGGKVYVVGGYVRDAYMGVEPNDVDLMVTDLTDKEIDKTLLVLDGYVNYTGISFGVFRYTSKDGSEVEISMPRIEISTGVGHKQFDVELSVGTTVEDDLFRRDFTVNAMAIDLDTDELIDPHGGLNDINTSTLVQVNPDSLNEDPIRILRALVAYARFGLIPTVQTKEIMKNNGANIVGESAERIRYELDKLMESKNPAAGIRLAIECDVLKYILPEVNDCVGYNQNNKHHQQQLGQHLVSVLEYVSVKTDDPDVRLAALLHDIGKPGSQWTDPETGGSHFYKKVYDDGSFVGQQHEELGAEMTKALMKRLTYSNERIKRVTDLVKFHMYPPFTTAKGARKFIHKVGDNADDLINIRWADQGGKTEYPSRLEKVYDLENEISLIDHVRQAEQPTSVSHLAIDGNDLIGIGIEKGPKIGEVLNELVEVVLDKPILNERDTLLELAQAHDAPPAHL